MKQTILSLVVFASMLVGTTPNDECPRRCQTFPNTSFNANSTGCLGERWKVG